MNDDYDFTVKSKADILLSYTANKGHRTRLVNKVKKNSWIYRIKSCQKPQRKL